MSESGKRGKDPLPFYQLPSSIKPCSKIIKDTRLQLKYSSKLGSDWEAAVIGDSGHPPAGPGGDVLRGMGGLSDFDLRVGTGTGAIRAVHTQRPFTPRDSANLWGVSARKRPPSAITLSRLSLDDIDEGRSTSMAKPKHRTGTGKPRQIQGQSLDSLDSDLSPLSLTGIGIDPRNDVELDRLRSRFKSMNVQNGKGSLAVSPLKEVGGFDPNGLVNNINSTKKARNGSASQISTTKNNIKNVSTPLPDRSVSNSGAEAYQTIKSLEVAVEYLKAFMESKEKTPKSELVSLLKRIKCIISQEPAEEHLKCHVIKFIFKLVEKNSNDPDLLFWSAFILLHCQIIGNNLTTVFKMVFKSSRSQEFLEIMQDSEYLEVFMNSLAQVCPLTLTESMIYGYGTLKFICSTDGALLQVMDLNLIGVMSLHLNILNLEIGTSRQVSENIQNGVFQLTSILRSVVGIEGSLPDVTNSGLLDEVCNCITWANDDIDVLSNIVRILSVVSCDDRCLEMLARNDAISGSFVKILQTWYARDDIIVRLTYCLGNILAKDEDMRIKMFHEPLAFDLLIKVIHYHVEHWTESSDDILVKSLRILANWSINPSIGAEISEDTSLSEILNGILQSENVSNELLLCAISTLNNITFYKSQSNTVLEEININTAECLLSYLNLKNLETRTETMKVLGNLTRNETVRASAANHIGALLISLEENHDELLCATIGVLMNTIVEERAREEFLHKGGLQFLLDLMQSKTDIGVNLMIYQFLWNLIVSGLTTESDGRVKCGILTETQLQDLTTLVCNKVGSVRGIQQKIENGGQELVIMGTTVTELASLCKDFLSVATNLQEKLFEL